MTDNIDEPVNMLTNPLAWQRAMEKAGLSESVIEYVEAEVEAEAESS